MRKVIGIVVTLALYMVVLTGCNEGRKSPGSTATAAESATAGEAKKEAANAAATGTNFRNYPADYRIAYLEMSGYTEAPTVRNLFGPNAPFLTTRTVILESATSSKNEFTGVLLLSGKNKNTGEDMRVARMQVKFQSDNMAERSYVRYIKFVNLVSGLAVEWQSYGSPGDDAETAGAFSELMRQFWDVSKLEK